MSARSVLIVIPAHNESVVLAENITQLTLFCRERLVPGSWRIEIAENGSTDDTAALGETLAALHPEVSVVRSASAGKGAAIRSAWENATEDVLVFMDADLATDLSILPTMVETIGNGADLVIGSRLAPGARVTRGPIRELGSRVYSGIARATLGVRARDLQCGCKAITRDAARILLPLIRSGAFFFDTELIAHAERAGLNIVELPVTWVDNRNEKRRSAVSASSVKLFAALVRDLFELRSRLGK